MNIFPIHSDQANRRHWVVRLLRCFGYIIVGAAVLFGLLRGRVLLSLLIEQTTGLDMELSAALGTVLGVLGGFLGGMLVSLPLWTMALIADDLHALRVYATGYAAVGEGDARRD